MTALAAWDPVRLTSYRMDQLASAFDRIRDARDWQAPIRAVIPVEERPVVEQAVLMFTNTVPEFAPAPGARDHLVVVARGYRLGQAAGPLDGLRS